jgi:hypothetical protein
MVRRARVIVEAPRTLQCAPMSSERVLMSGSPERLSFQARCSVPVSGFTASEVQLKVRMLPLSSGRRVLPQVPKLPITARS